MAGRLWGWLGWDGLLPILGYIVLVFLLIPGLPFHVSDWLGAGDTLAPSDANGTIWFWWWVSEAYKNGLDLLNPQNVCAPFGQNLGPNFPNRIDALLVMPFFWLFAFPTSYNLAILTIPVLDSWLGYLFLRRLTSLRFAAWVGGALFGFNAYTFSEINGGRPVTGLIACLPLFGMVFLEALERPVGSRLPWWGWAIAAGGAGSLALQSYLPFALFLLIFGVAASICRVVVPAEGVSRLRPLWVGVITAVLGLLLSMSYVHEVAVVRGVGPAGGRVIATTPARVYEPRLWTELNRIFSVRSVPRVRPAHSMYYLSVQNQSQPWFYLWKMPGGEASKRVFFPHLLVPVLIGVALGGGLLARRGRSGVWVGATVLMWSLTVGPYLCEVVEQNGLRWLMVGGQRVTMPLAWILYVAPGIEGFLRPYRAFPLVLLCLMAAAVVGTQGGYEWLKKKNLSEVKALTLVGLLWLGVGAYGRVQLLGGDWTLLTMSHWKTDPFIEQLGQQEEDFAIAELPAGIGHGTSLLQIVHQKRRSEGHHDELFTAVNNRPPPPSCYKMPFLQALWYLGRSDADAQNFVTANLTPQAIANAQGAGFRYILVYPEGYGAAFNKPYPASLPAVLDELRSLFGEPVYTSARIIAFEISP